MYARDCSAVAAYGLSRPERLGRVGLFVLLTIRQPLEYVPSAMRDVDARREASKALWGSKSQGYAYFQAHAPALHQELSRAIRSRDSEAAMLAALRVPGLGLAKAGFLCQLLGDPTAACMDSHNLRRLGYPEAAFKRDSSRLSPKALSRHVTNYLDACTLAGGPETLWNGWCDYVAALRPKIWQSSSAVSAAHVTAILPSPA